jgi:hypothetical protein
MKVVIAIEGNFDVSIDLKDEYYLLTSQHLLSYEDLESYQDYHLSSSQVDIFDLPISIDDLSRHDKNLINAIENIGISYAGNECTLHIIEIEDGIKYNIVNMHGREWVETKINKN